MKSNIIRKNQLIILLSISIFISSCFLDSVFGSTGCGDYPGTYSFEQDNVGSNPASWTIDESAGALDVIETIDNHHKIVKINDTDNPFNTEMTQSISVSYGTLELWLRAQQTSHRFLIHIFDSGLGDIYFIMENGGSFRFINNTGTHDLPIPTTYSVDVWYHIKLVFDCSTTTYEVFIDGISKGKCYYYDDPVTFDTITISSYGPTIGINYIDAIGYSWDPNYNVGDNMQESCINDNPEGGIPFGDFYLIFLFIGILSLVMKYKKKHKYVTLE